MATSGTVAFEPSITQCIEEAYERCQVQLTSGYNLKTALFSLNILFSEWGNRGLHFWTVSNTNIYINSGQNTYDIYKNAAARGSDTTNPARSDASSTFIYNATDILTASYRTNDGTTDQSDITLTKIDRSTYAALTNKESQGTPSQFWIQRFINKTTLTSYITPGSSQAGKFFNIYYVRRIEDPGIAFPDTGAPQTTGTPYANHPEVPYRFYPCLVSGLAFYLSQKINPAKTQELKLYYEDELERALAEDGSASSSFITPQTYYPAVS